MHSNRFTGKYLASMVRGRLAAIEAGAVRTSLYMCQLPDFAEWVASQGQGLSSDEVELLGATQLRYPEPSRVPMDSTIDFLNFLDFHRHQAMDRLASASPSNSEPHEVVYDAVG